MHKFLYRINGQGMCTCKLISKIQFLSIACFFLVCTSNTSSHFSTTPSNSVLAIYSANLPRLKIHNGILLQCRISSCLKAFGFSFVWTCLHSLSPYFFFSYKPHLLILINFKQIQDTIIFSEYMYILYFFLKRRL